MYSFAAARSDQFDIAGWAGGGAGVGGEQRTAQQLGEGDAASVVGGDVVP